MFFRSRWYESVLTLLLFASLATNLGLGVEVSRLRSVVAALKAGGGLQGGTVLPDMPAFNTSGRSVTVRFRDSALPTVLYVFSPACKWCARNMPNLKALQGSAPGRYRLVGISLHPAGLEQYSARHGLDFPIVTSVDPKFVSRYHLGGTPQTIVVSPAGRVIQSWTGAYDAEIRGQVERALGVVLPGMKMDLVP